MEQSHTIKPYFYTKIPNEILDNLDKYTPIECKIMMLIARQTLGYADVIYEFSISYICSKIGHKKPAIIKAVKGLLKKKFIVNLGVGQRGIRSFGLAINSSLPVSTDAKIDNEMLSKPIIKCALPGNETGNERLPDPITESYPTDNERLPQPVTEDYQIRSPSVTMYLLNNKYKEKTTNEKRKTAAAVAFNLSTGSTTCCHVA